MIASMDLMPLMSMSMSDIEKFIAQKIVKWTPWYTRFVSNATLEFDIDGTYYSGTGFGVVEKMDME